MKNNKIEFTICIPTFNRGKIAYNNLTAVLKNQKIPKNCKILILDNGSNSEEDYYSKIKKLSKKNNQIDYIRHPANILFAGNYLACFELCSSDYFMIVSDEDIPKMSSIKDIIKTFKKNKKLAIIRGSIATLDNVTPAQAVTYNDDYFMAGKEALMNFTLNNNYVSGMIYNNKLIKKFNLLNSFKKNFMKHEAYPHLYFEILICAKCDVHRSSKVVIYEGEMNKSTVCNDTGLSYNPYLYQFPFSLGCRIDQIVGLRNGFIESVISIDESNELFIDLYIMLAKKYFYLISSVNSPMYKENKLNMSYVRKSTLNFLCAAILDYQEIKHYHEDIIKMLHKLYNLYEDKQGE